MRFLAVWLVALTLVSGCAALKRTETLPSPNDADSLGGPEGEDNDDSLYLKADEPALLTGPAASSDMTGT